MKASKLIGSISISMAIAFLGMAICISLASAEVITAKQAATTGTILGAADIVFMMGMFLLWVRKNIDT